MSDNYTIEAYNKIARDYQSRNSVTLYSEEYSIYKTCIGERNRVLEIGCGIGRDARELINLGFQYVGIDASEGMLSIAREQVPNGQFMIGDFYKLNFRDATFDGFWAAASFLHVPKIDIRKVLYEAKRVLIQQGIAFISLKEKTSIDEGIITETKAGGISRYFSFYTQEEFSHILEENGFEVLRVTTKQEEDADKTKWLCFFARKK